MAEDKHSWKDYLKKLGPGLITGAADDDPSGIATCSQAGAQFGYGQLWTALFILPLMIAIKECFARIGIVNGKGIEGAVRDNYSSYVLFPVIVLVLTANTINIGADIGAMAASAGLIFEVPAWLLTIVFTGLIVSLELFTSYRQYSRTLKWLTLALFAYPLSVIIIEQPWGEILTATFLPHIEPSFAFLFIITGVLGTTISPYMFFWEASQEVEEQRSAKIRRRPVRGRISGPHIDSYIGPYIRDMRMDNAVGMLSSEIATWCIFVVGATVLHKNGITDIQTAADAARALEPLVQTFPHSGLLSKIIFSSGVIGLGLLAVPVLAGSAAYAVAEAFGWRGGIDFKFKQARYFYLIMTGATVIGLLLNFIGVSPFKALVYAAVLNGVAAVPLIYLILRISGSKTVMGKYANSALSNFFVWLAFLGMGAAALSMFLTFRG
ncbi:MAG: divalent metal cation transporter [Syntrophaceae bacterium]